MRLTTAHKILIGSAVAFFAFYGLWELAHFARSRAGSDLLAALLALAGAAGLALYLRSFLRSLDRPRR